MNLTTILTLLFSIGVYAAEDLVRFSFIPPESVKPTYVNGIPVFMTLPLQSVAVKNCVLQRSADMVHWEDFRGLGAKSTNIVDLAGQDWPTNACFIRARNFIPVAITRQPVGLIYSKTNIPSVVSYSISAVGTQPLTYTWKTPLGIIMFTETNSTGKSTFIVPRDMLKNTTFTCVVSGVDGQPVYSYSARLELTLSPLPLFAGKYIDHTMQAGTSSFYLGVPSDFTLGVSSLATHFSIGAYGYANYVSDYMDCEYYSTNKVLITYLGFFEKKKLTELLTFTNMTDINKLGGYYYISSPYAPEKYQSGTFGILY